MSRQFGQHRAGRLQKSKESKVIQEKKGKSLEFLLVKEWEELCEMQREGHVWTNEKELGGSEKTFHNLHTKD